MKLFRKYPMLFLVVMVLLATSGGIGLAAASQTDVKAVPDVSARSLLIRRQMNCTRRRAEEVEISDAKLIVEYQSTDGDLGVHGQFDDDGWSKLCVFDPDGRQILAVKPQSTLKELTMASIFFESREPLLEEFSFDDLKEIFPEGEYEVRAISFEGEILTGSATFTHDIPAPPTITAPELGEDEESAEDAVVSITDLVITWEDVDETVDGDPITLSGYEVIVTKEDHDDPNGFSRPIFDVHLPPDRNSLTVPEEFFEADTVYELEVLALEESGNQTITVGFFQTDEPESSDETMDFDNNIVTISSVS